jgi:hypothetical protein
VCGQQAQASTHAQATLSTPGAERAILGAALYLTLIGLMAIGLGLVIRSTAGAIATLFAIVLVAPILASALSKPYSTDVSKYLPLNAGAQVITTINSDPNLPVPGPASASPPATHSSHCSQAPSYSNVATSEHPSTQTSELYARPIAFGRSPKGMPAGRPLAGFEPIAASISL